MDANEKKPAVEPPSIDWAEKMISYFGQAERCLHTHADVALVHATLAQAAATRMLAEAVRSAGTAQMVGGALSGLGSLFQGSELSSKLAAVVTTGPWPVSE